MQDMGTLPESFDLGALFQYALEEYEKETKINLARHPLAHQLERCDSVESITQALQEQAKEFSEFRGSNHKAIKLLKNTVQALHKLSGTAAVAGSIGLVCRKRS